MSAAKKQKRDGSRPANLLGKEDRVYLLGLLVPLLVYDVALKVVRVVNQPDVPGVVGFLEQVRSEVLFNLGFAALWVGLFAIIRGGLARWTALVLFHLSATVLVALSTTAHFYYETTGLPFDLSLITFFLSTLGETKAVIASETSARHWFLISAVLLYVILGPAILTRLFFYRWHPPIRSGGLRLASIAPCAAAAILVTLAFLPSATGASPSFSRDAVVNMVAAEVATVTRPEIETELATEDLPTDTHLSPTPRTQKRNVVLVFLESTRAQSTTPYNSSPNTTPYMEKLAGDSLVAKSAYAVVPHTSKALTASTCGVAPPLDTQMTESEPDAIPGRCLGDLLEDEGYSTAFFQSATKNFERRRALVKNFGYEDFRPVESMDKWGFQKVNYFGYEDNVMLEPSRKWLAENGDGPFLASYLTVTPHHDYVVPDRYGKKRFAQDGSLNRYLNTLRYEDFFLRNLIQQYKDMGLYEDTVFIVLGDHGEGFGEHGRYQHDDVIYNEGLKIPMIIHDPKREESGRIEPPVNELDILPTVADLLGYDVRGGTYPGASMLSPPEQRTLMASCFHDNRCLASFRGDEKYIYHYGNQPGEFYELSEDPRELNNVAGQHRKEIKDRRREMLAWESKVDATYEEQLTRGETTEE